MELAKLSEKIEFEIDGEAYSIEPCLYDDEGTPALKMNFPNGEIIQVALHNFSDSCDLKKFVISQLKDYKFS